MREPPGALRLLLRLYPRPHRAAYGAEMWDVVRYRFSRADGRSRRARATAVAAADLAWSALGVWTTTARRGSMGLVRGCGLDARFVLRALGRSPGYVATAVVVLAAAVAVNAAVFSYVRGTLLAPPTFPDADRVVLVWGSNPLDGQVRDVISGPTFIDLARETSSLEALAAFHADGAALERDDHPDVQDVLSVSADFFRVVPVKPLLGRVFGDEDRTSSGPAVVLVSHGFWRDRLGADPSWVGRPLPLDGEPHTVVGVLPEGFEFILDAPLWRPLRDDELAADERYRIHYHLFGRLRPGATAADATADLSGVMRKIAQEHQGYERWSVLAEPLRDAEVMAVRPILWTVTGAVGLILLIALVNLATLFRIRALGRADELGVRLALGGSAVRVGRVLAMESVGLAVVGALAGLAAAPALLAWVRDLVPLWIVIPDSAARVPVLRSVLDPWVAAAALGLAVLGALALTVPALTGALRAGASAWGGRSTRRSPRVRWLVAGELALATVLCLGAGLTTRSADKLLATEVGLKDDGLLTLWVGDVWERPIPEQVTYFREIVEAVERVPGVASAALVDYIPFQGEDDFARLYFLDRSFQPVRDLREEWRRVTGGLFETAGMRVLAGRSFAPEDFEGTPRTAVVNAAFARKHYPDGNAVGSFLSTHNAAYRDLTIVGVVDDVRERGPANPATPMLYVPLQGDPRGTTGMYVRVAAGDPMAAAGPVRDAIWSVDPSQPITDLTPMGELVASWVAIPRATRALVSGLAGLALLLAGVGVFGVVAYAVRTRTREWGVRVALGASPAQLKRGVLGEAVPMLVWGVGGGLAAGLVVMRAARAVLYGVEPADPVSVGAALAAMAGAALLGTWLPVRRVSRLDPTEAIRAE